MTGAARRPNEPSSGSTSRGGFMGLSMGSIRTDKIIAAIQKSREGPAPIPMPIPGREEDEAKKKVRRRMRRGGRQSTILAGNLNAQNNNILSTRLG